MLDPPGTRGPIGGALPEPPGIGELFCGGLLEPPGIRGPIGGALLEPPELASRFGAFATSKLTVDSQNWHQPV